jgi:outer membrane lipoprotein-sorting protein
MMSFGTVLRRAAFCCLTLHAVSSYAAAWNIDALMAELSQAKPARAKFVEKKTMSMLDEPIVSSGELLYVAPDKLERKTIKPRPEMMLVDGDRITLKRGGRTHTLSLQEYPELAGLIDSIRGTLAGNRQMLERSFNLKLDGSRTDWKLTLMPTDTSLTRMIRVIRMEGTHEKVRTIELEQMDGDSSIMTIEPLSGK